VFLLSKDFWNQVKVALAIFFAIVFTSSILLHLCTRHNSYLAVPDFKSLTYSEAQELADDNDMRLSIMDSVYHQDLRPGTVIDQEPKPGIEVKKNRRIFLVMNAINPEMVEMPNITGVSLRQALSILESNGLNPGKLKYVPDIATNNVLRQKFEGKEIVPGKKIKKGSHIDMVLGNSGAGPVELPNLQGLTIHEVERQLALSSLNLGAVIYDNTVNNAIDSTQAIVLKQKPEIEDVKYVNMGSLIDLWMGIKMEPKVTTDKNEETE
jgi:beta-lactam-binding protein with PASTA domain